MTAADRKTLRRVATILKREADFLRQSHTKPPEHKEWDLLTLSDEIARESHDEMLALSRLLRAMALRP